MRILLSTLLLVCLTGLAQEANDVLYIQPGKEVYETGENLESGNLIDGVEGVVAFKATYGNGMPEDVSGVVTEDGREIATIRSQHDGMGKFDMTPRRGRDYRVALSDGRTYPLPAIEQRGLALRVTRNNKSGITLLVSAPDTVARRFTVLAKMRGIGKAYVRKPLRQHSRLSKRTSAIPAKGFSLRNPLWRA